MKNKIVGEKGQKIVEEFFKSRGYEVDRTYEKDNSLPYDLMIRAKGSKGRWKKVQVKTTRGPRLGVLTFRTRKTSENRKVLYDRKDLDLFVFVDAKTKSVVMSPFVKKGCFKFSSARWNETCKV